VIATTSISFGTAIRYLLNRLLVIVDQASPPRESNPDTPTVGCRYLVIDRNAIEAETPGGGPRKKGIEGWGFGHHGIGD
jgi:hypothetical protein